MNSSSKSRLPTISVLTMAAVWRMFSIWTIVQCKTNWIVAVCTLPTSWELPIRCNTLELPMLPG